MVDCTLHNGQACADSADWSAQEARGLKEMKSGPLCGLTVYVVTYFVLTAMKT